MSLVDDLDGGKAADTVAFGLDGPSFEIDLNVAALRNAWTEFVEPGRQVKPHGSARGRAGVRSVLRWFAGREEWWAGWWNVKSRRAGGGVMTVVADGLEVSGQRYRVTAVDGRRPAGLEHCVGVRVLTVDRNGLCHRMFGRGVETTGVFRFHQQDLGSTGTVVLVWTIKDSGDGTLVIEPTADR